MKIARKVKEDPKSFYAYIRSKRMVKVKTVPLLSPKGDLVHEDEDMAEILNNQFSSAFTM